MSDCEPYLGNDDRYALSSDASINTGQCPLDPGAANVDTTLVLGVSSTVGQIKLGHCQIQIRPLMIKTGQHQMVGTDPESTMDWAEIPGLASEPVIGPRFARTRWTRPGMTRFGP
jgi:hypothetical protein